MQIEDEFDVAVDVCCPKAYSLMLGESMGSASDQSTGYHC
jgi:hypothetical protein